MSQTPVICFLTGTMNAYAGAERMTAVVANALAARGYVVHIVSLFDPTTCFALHPDVELRALFDTRPSFKRHYLTAIRRIREDARRHGIDIMIEVDPMLTLFTLPALARTGVRRIGWEHCHFGEDLGKPLRRVARRLAARTASAIVVLTAADQAHWRTAIRHAFDVRAIANPLPFDLPAEPAAGNTRKVLAVGRLVPAKGFDVLLRAWKTVAVAAPGWQLEIVGEGAERQALQTLIEELGIGDTVSMPGARRDVETAYRGASVFCLSSRYEGFGLVLLEAMAHGLPVVATACDTGPRSLLQDGVNARVVPVDSADALAAGLLDVMDSPPLRHRLTEGGRQTARAHTVDQIVGQWESLLRDVAARA